MLSQSNIDVPNTLQMFKDRGIKVGFLVPTETGLQKSIMDAHNSLRRFFASSGLHDYEKQSQGSADKRVVSTTLWSRGGVVDTKTSLYRPETKNGDPRIWVYELSRHANPGDLLAIAHYENRLLVINCSQCDLNDLLSESHEWMIGNFPVTKLLLSPVADELLSKLGEISRLGWIKTLRKGDTGVGFTLESMLGISANSSKSPDYKGIELKSGRSNKQIKRQTTVFSQVPNWKISTLKGSKDILEKHGRYNNKKERIQLFHEISCLKPNSYDLQLDLESGGAQLDQIFIRPDGKIDRDVTWLMDKLVSRVEEKHAESMWVSAENRGRGEAEEFWYRKVKHTKGVDQQALPILLESGAMTVHYLIKQLPSGAAKDQGYLFKMSPQYLPTLFNEARNYELPHP
jgi:hypothetical protein